MPIRQLEYQVKEETLPLSLIRDCRIGIEGNYWLRKILKSQGGTDQTSLDSIRMNQNINNPQSPPSSQLEDFRLETPFQK
jgi:hypothetical protein